MKGDYLHNTLIKFLVKANECGFDVVPIIFDGAPTNVKVAKKLLKLKNESKNNTSISAAALKLKTSFEYEWQIYFVMFCSFLIIKNWGIICSKKTMNVCIPN